MNRITPSGSWCLIAQYKGEELTRITRGYKTQRDAIIAEYTIAGPEVYTTIVHSSSLPEVTKAIAGYMGRN